MPEENVSPEEEAPPARYILKPVVYPAFTVYTVFRTDLKRYVYGDKSEDQAKAVLERLLGATEEGASEIEREQAARWQVQEPVKPKPVKKAAPKRGIAAAVSAVFDDDEGGS